MLRRLSSSLLFLMGVFIIFGGVFGQEFLATEKVEGAKDIRNRQECKRAHGIWSEEVSDGSDLKSGCRIAGLWEGLVRVQDMENISDVSVCLVWYIGGLAEGDFRCYDKELGYLSQTGQYKADKLEGVLRKYDKEGRILFLVHYQNGILNGEAAHFKKDCLPYTIGEYKDGVLDGVLKEYSLLSGALEKEERYKGGVLHGLSRYYAKGKVYGEGNYVHGKKDGVWTYYAEKGGIFKRYYYVMDNFIDYHASRCFKEGRTWKWDVGQMSEFCVSEDNLEEGKAYVRYPGGALRELKHYVHGQLHGMFYEFYPDGSLMHKGEYYEDRPIGEHVFYRSSGEVFDKVEIINGVGEWRRYWHNGNLRESGRYIGKGRDFGAEYYKKDGEWIYYYENGGMERLDTYKNNLLHGPSRTWFYNGVLSSEAEFYEGGRVGKYKGYWTHGVLAWVQDEDMGVEEYYASGALKRSVKFSATTGYRAKEYFNHGKLKGEGAVNFMMEKDGQWTEYLYTGNRWRNSRYESDNESSEASEFCQDEKGVWSVEVEDRHVGCYLCRVNEEDYMQPEKIPHGLWQWWHSNGNMEKSGSFLAGLKEGGWIYWYSSGLVMHTGNYVKDKPDGVWKGYYENGRKRFDGQYKDGAEDGKWRSYYEDGRLQSEGEYMSGKREGEWVWYQDREREGGVDVGGESVVEKGVYKEGKEEGVWKSYYKSGELLGEGKYVDGKREGEWIWYRKDGSVWRKAQYKAGREVV